MKKALVLICSMLVGGFCFAQRYQSFSYEETRSVNNASYRSVAYHCAMAFVNQNFTKFESFLTADFKKALKDEMQKEGKNYVQLYDSYYGTNPVKAIRPALNAGYEPNCWLDMGCYEEGTKAKCNIAFVDSQFNAYLNKDGNQELFIRVKMVKNNGSWKVYKIEFYL